MSKKIDLYLLTCLSNLHVGSGDTTYAIIDKEVQRDVITEFPVIHSSGLKGAFRELMAFLKNPDNVKEGHKNAMVEKIFGSEKDRKPGEKLVTGSYTFFDACLLFLPVRSNVKPYFFATSIEQLTEFRELLKLHYGGVPNGFTYLENIERYVDFVKKPVVNDGFKGADLEDYKAISTKQIEESVKNDFEVFFNGLQKWVSPLAIFPYNKLKELVKELPVIARNNLENGMSKNLWYEEVVPRQSIFYYFITRPSDNDALNLEIKTKNNNLVQVGGNSTVGYGLCRVERKASESFVLNQKKEE